MRQQRRPAPRVHPCVSIGSNVAAGEDYPPPSFGRLGIKGQINLIDFDLMEQKKHH
jgi:hypothetical protein